MARPLPQPVRTYRVGGSVRDELLERPQADRDWVVVGATPETMIASGFKPVGRDFPVFLHPDTREEYALARTERKHGTGYRGFQFFATPEVTLEEDLARRDLTINAMARDERGELVDPHGGAKDLAAGVLRHVSPAFAEDPLRVLRVARFAARFGFAVAAETEGLMRAIVRSGELATLAAERVWQELARGLMEPVPSRMLAVLRQCGALAALLPEVDALYGVPQPPAHHPEVDAGVHVALALDYAAARGNDIAVRYATLCHDLGKGATPRDAWPRHLAHEARSVRLAERVSERLRVPAECRDVARLTARYHLDVAHAEELRPATLLDLLGAIDALRRPARLDAIRAACAADRNSRPGRERDGDRPGEWLAHALSVVRRVDAGAIAKAAAPDKIEGAVRYARLKALRMWRDREKGGLLLE
jgi:tRNA nucleotidyltransferase (CCA-adding enzyme)